MTKATDLNLKINPSKSKAMLMKMNKKTLKLTLDGKPLETVNTHKYLGIHFDRGLRFGAHIREMKRSIMERMNMIKVIAGNRHGGHPLTLGLIYHGIVRGYLDYGASIYNNASKSNLEALMVANNACLRKVTGCSKTTPINTLHAIASQKPLNYRRELITGKELIKHAQYNTPVYKQMRQIDETTAESSEQTNLEKTYWCYKSLVDNMSQTTTVQTKSIITINTDLGSLWSKANTSARVLKQLTLNLINGKFKDHRQIFTDASRMDDTCGIGIYDEKSNTRISLRLENPVCSMSAEIEAIYVALQHIERNHINNAVILTDSKAECEFILNQITSMERDEVIHEIITKAARTNTCIQWIPGHVNIMGNELADKLARNGLRKVKLSKNKIFPHDAINIIENITTIKIQNWYVSYTQELGKGRKFFNIQTGINKKSWYHNLSLSNTETRTLNRLTSGHDYSPYWLSIMKASENRFCTICDKPNTSEHIILQCTKHNSLRKQLNLDNYKTIQEVFTNKNMDHLRNMMKLLKEINIQV
ncbi:uncharacterized protein LOC129726926 isoform X1 [Wyeomyia smithii]|uniref:uncharacterized protein LOC129726926 isoform X1 n=1 Tax=Wyeomyia smithii TaxID=174621 RepID=UPI002467F5A5|nr:uncharacterized protein LOC129726926 isoform X1 [Wyeomyia smithii]XP_055540166.1 uncharacterized protein LOC129726926 isoform X1 [Wyeomyia smithii]